ncbi:hypothetical protein GGS21DRAFT_511681 [Xylaria nigripes]|nr:hypothetical protein GGS21DRAFT_511681 [Xylaria nigripes]
MPYFETSQEWLRQSAMLLEARPSTTRITTTYHQTDKTGTSSKRQKKRQQKLQEAQPAAPATTTATTTTTPAAPRASLTIKTYDPNSGVCLKYRTTKAAEVSRLILSLGQLGKKMAALPSDTDVSMPDATTAPEDVASSGIEGAATTTAAGAKGQTQTQAGGGGKGKKKRAKK